MIDKKQLEEFIKNKLSGTDLYPVEITITPDNVIKVELDSDTMVDLEECIRLTREIEEEFDRDKEDYELEVGSAGITSPLKLPRQYKRYIGKEMEVLTKEGKKLKGLLVEANENGFTLRIPEKIKTEGEKRPHIEERDKTFGYEEIKETKYLLKI